MIDLVKSEIRPCPLELSSYLEASYTCVPGNLKIVKFNGDLHSFAENECSGKPSCQFHVTELVRRNIKPCPLELSSYLEASQICVPSNVLRLKFCEFAKFCRYEMFRKAEMLFPRDRVGTK